MEEQLTRIDKAKNRIYLWFRGYMEPDRAMRLHDAYRDAIAQMKPGFTVVTLAEDYKPGDERVQAVVQTMTMMADRAGCRKVARVVGKSPLGAMQINRLAKVKVSYPAKHFITLEEAEAYLDSNEDE